ncbi:4Fe-4S binding domain-containing protein [Dethiosulfatibacter aminovorans DSM 17477]|uniref:4Fe-4S binding domain-containing protein n=1 Tax=Dethiosulfatibacter aminovorans DSM 17477 TaxID=1121476 RepID=A0A1M6EBM4_9FIRM|nr:4Fe-4S dicluster domain-containing protein [Dethiosulfatibacter aminovorans]SHI82851.1 4Fe-4S binding domain-containing protein [Dethiosulfatibacter aminovorans DSM 17477]
MLETNGVATEEQIMKAFPSMETINKGPVAVIECFQEIPCNPCVTSCRFHAIDMGDNINNLPEVSPEKCIGCGVCLGKCPGLAIMLVDGSKSEEYIHMSIPYEMLPVPQKDQMVRGLDREGNYLCDVRVVKVLESKSLDRTLVVTLEVPRDLLYKFRNIEVEVKG